MRILDRLLLTLLSGTLLAGLLAGCGGATTTPAPTLAVRVAEVWELTTADAVLKLDLEAAVPQIAAAEEALAKQAGKTWDPRAIAGSHPMCVRWSPDGELIAVGLHAKEVRVFNAQTGALVGWGPSPHLPVFWHLALAWSADSQRVFSGGGDHVVWELERAKEFHAGARGFRPVETWTCDLDLDPTGRYLAAAGKEGRVRIWEIDEPPLAKGVYGFNDVPPLRAWREPLAHEKKRVPLAAVAWSPDGKELLAGGVAGLHLFQAKNADGTLASTGRKLEYLGAAKKDAWDARVGGVLELPLLRELETFVVPKTRAILALDWSPDGRWAVSGQGAWTDALKPTDRHPVRLWNTADWTSRVLDYFAPRVWATRFAPDGALLAVGGAREVRLYRTSDWARVGTLGGFRDEVNSLDWSPDGTRLAVGAGGEKFDKHGDPFLGGNPVAAEPFVYVFKVRPEAAPPPVEVPAKTKADP